LYNINRASFLISQPEAPCCSVICRKQKATGKTELACGYLSCRQPLMFAFRRSGLTDRSVIKASDLIRNYAACFISTLPSFRRYSVL